MNHGISDGNKRTARATGRVFLADIVHGLEIDPADAIRTIEDGPAGRVGEDELAEWFRSRPTG